jgi:hypothetical protein
VETATQDGASKAVLRTGVEATWQVHLQIRMQCMELLVLVCMYCCSTSSSPVVLP